ncbi:hypothetical protein NQ317_016492 [Molorchus minor]|uniref:Uncharacterized protein n=1 Tax=Molorchus minor TaxID=1323400 RepID=A0ABQ9JFA0_9CUCU|nr:hypothetical protein NQ317_016492 [Molorchus minor]
MINILCFFVFCITFCVTVQAKVNDTNKCDIPPSAPKKIEEVINQCQDEIKLAILTEALQALSVTEDGHSRAKRAAFTDDERRIAGVNSKGFPTVEGLVALYTEGITKKDYILATVQAVNLCLNNAHKKFLTTPQAIDDFKFENRI